jgi:hypothetical protein
MPRAVTRLDPDTTRALTQHLPRRPANTAQSARFKALLMQLDNGEVMVETPEERQQRLVRSER